MALSWNTLRYIPRLTDYAAASKREAETKPVRGDELQRKPLGRRDQKYRHIKRMDDGSIGIFEYETVVPHIRYLQNGDIEVADLSSWVKSTYNEVLCEVLGLFTYTERGKAWVRYDGGVAPLRPGPKMQYVPGEGWTRINDPYVPSVFRKNERGNLVYINPPGISTHVVNRKGAKAVRTRYMAPLTYIEALVKLRRDDTPSDEEVMRAFPEVFPEVFPEEYIHSQHNRYPWYLRSKLPLVHNHTFKREHAVTIADLMCSEDPGDHYRAYLWLQWDSHSDNVMHHAERVLQWVHRDEWFTEREAIVGQKAHDRHAWAFKD